MAGRPCISVRKDGRSQRRSLAKNIPANAANKLKAVHRGGEWGKDVQGVKGFACDCGFAPLAHATQARMKVRPSLFYYAAACPCEGSEKYEGCVFHALGNAAPSPLTRC